MLIQPAKLLLTTVVCYCTAYGEDIISRWDFTAASANVGLNEVIAGDGAELWRMPRWNVNIPDVQTSPGQGLRLYNDGSGGTGRRTAFVDLVEPLSQDAYTVSMVVRFSADSGLSVGGQEPVIALSWIEGDAVEVATVRWTPAVAASEPTSNAMELLLVVDFDTNTWRTGTLMSMDRAALAPPQPLPNGVSRLDSLRLAVSGDFSQFGMNAAVMLEAIEVRAGVPVVETAPGTLPELRIHVGAQGAVLHITEQTPGSPPFQLYGSHNLVDWEVIALQSDWIEEAGRWQVPVHEIFYPLAAASFFRLQTTAP